MFDASFRRKIYAKFADFLSKTAKMMRFAAYARAIEILKAHQAEVEELADCLLREKHITGWP